MELLHFIAQFVYDKKGFNIFAIDVRNISSLTDYVIIAEANVERHAVSIAKQLLDALKEKGEEPIYLEGMNNGDWIVLDFVDFMVHIFLPPMRTKYQIERLFPEAKIVDLQIDLHRYDETAY